MIYQLHRITHDGMREFVAQSEDIHESHFTEQAMPFFQEVIDGNTLLLGWFWEVVTEQSKHFYRAAPIGDRNVQASGGD